MRSTRASSGWKHQNGLVRRVEAPEPRIEYASTARTHDFPLDSHHLRDSDCRLCLQPPRPDSSLCLACAVYLRSGTSRFWTLDVEGALGSKAVLERIRPRSGAESMNKSGSAAIDEKKEEPGDWRGKMLARCAWSSTRRTRRSLRNGSPVRI